MTKQIIKPCPDWSPLKPKDDLKSAKNRVNSLIKGLRIIETLNKRQSLNANEISTIVGTSRGTTYRILETLREAGYVQRDQASGIYWLEPAILSLTEGSSRESWVWKIALPIMERVSEETVWPLSLVTQHGMTMIVRATTDSTSPATLHYMTSGSRMPMLSSGSGLIYLAFCEPNQQKLLIELAQKSSSSEERSSQLPGPLLAQRLEDIRKQGYCIYDGGHRITIIAVPILAKEGIVAVLALRYFSSAMRFKEGLARYLEPISDAAEEIARQFDHADF